MATSNLVQGREKRSTAGNRMQALLDGEFEAEEAFMEIENDEEFVGKDEDDVFDEDFQETDSEDGDDELAGEKALQIEERDARKIARSKLGRSALIPRVTLKLKGTSSKARSGNASPSKRRRVALGAVVDAATGEPLTRNSSRKATVQHTQQTIARLKAANKRRASLPKRHKAAVAPKTQDTLIREALELEERNVESLKAFLTREEEKKKQARVVRTRVEPPLLRWISRTEGIDAREGPRIQIISTSPSDGNANDTSALTTTQDGSSRDTHSSAVLSAPPPPASHAPNTTKGEFIRRETDQHLCVRPDTTPLRGGNRDTRNYVVVQLARGGKKVSEMEALFGKHTDWSRVANMRREEQKQEIAMLKASKCAVTGLTPLYLDPRNGIPYANSRAYKTLSRTMRHEYVWSQNLGCYTNDSSDEGAKGVPPQWKDANQNGGVRPAIQFINPRAILTPTVSGPTYPPSF
ncbi:hypothetical protein FRB99_000531 [Tulasnella sp. 403]|nr:hypothetical protein FRB99_000531 [Tulasnella sp. 403]